MKILKTIGYIIGLFCVWSIGSFIAGAIYVIINGGSVTAIEKIGSSALVMTIILITVIVAVMIRYGVTNRGFIKRLDLKKISLKDSVYCSGIAFIVSALSMIVNMLLINFFPSYQDVANFIDQANSSIGGIIGIVIIVPIMEEIIFRGLIFGHLRQNYNIKIAIVVQALIFAVAHGNPIQTIYTFILGLVAGILLLKTKSLVAPIILHSVNNLLGGVIMPMFIESNPIIVAVIMVSGIALGCYGSVKMFKSSKEIKRLA